MKDQAIRAALGILVSGRELDETEMAAAMGTLMDGEATPGQIGAFLALLRAKGESIAEVLGAVNAMRARMARVETGLPRLLDTCGTGGDGAHTFNVSTAAAFCAAAAGVPVAKHGNRAVSSRVGSADVLEALGVRIDLSPDAARRCLREVGIGFFFAPTHHGALRHAAAVRRELGFRTLMNLLGPLSNPAGATHQLVGVYDGARAAPLAEVFGRLGSKRALVVHGSDGLDELTLAGESLAALWDGERVASFTVTPEEVGLRRAGADALRGGDAAANAALLRRILAGEVSGPPADVVRLNAGAALWVAEAAPTLGDGVALASRVLAEGKALRKLDELAERSTALGAEP
jgi:anthranilate phosphoribosyltransferase